MVRLIYEVGAVDLYTHDDTIREVQTYSMVNIYSVVVTSPILMYVWRTSHDRSMNSSRENVGVVGIDSPHMGHFLATSEAQAWANWRYAMCPPGLVLRLAMYVMKVDALP